MLPVHRWCVGAARERSCIDLRANSANGLMRHSPARAGSGEGSRYELLTRRVADPAFVLGRRPAA
jgi:hypothetical protein